MRKHSILAIAAVAMLGAAGCDTSRLETGYQPRPLGGTDPSGAYASPFSERAMRHQQEQQQLPSPRSNPTPSARPGAPR